MSQGASSRPARWTGGPFLTFGLLYAALYIGFGTESPFLPAFLGERGLGSEQIGTVLALGTVVRLLAGPAAGAIADRYDGAPLVLAVCAVGAGLISFAYLPARGFGLLLAVGMAHSVVIAPLAPIADATALAAADREHGFAYGWVRGVGSAAFVLGTLASGQLVGGFGLDSIIVASGAMFALMGAVALGLPRVRPAQSRDEGPGGLAGFLALLRIPAFRMTVLVAALVIGSHALNDAFAVIRWREAGLTPGTVSLLWSAAVVSEVAVFLLLGPALLERIGPANCAILAALAGVLRWAVLATTTDIAALTAAQLSHGLTFALLHLAAMRLIAEHVPDRLAASAQTIYGNVGLGTASAVLTASSGFLFARLDASAFWVMAGLCGLALPFAAMLRRPSRIGYARPSDGRAADGGRN